MNSHASDTRISQPDTIPFVMAIQKSCSWYKSQLKHSNTSKSAVNYLHGRGVSSETISEFELGYAPPGWHNLITAMHKWGVSAELLSGCGLAVESDEKNRHWDRFRDRIIFPIMNVEGVIVGAGGRVLNDDKPKYLNTPETPIFQKSEILYGLFQATRLSEKLEKLIIVEGYMDVVSLSEFGIRNAVGTLGTACTHNQIALGFQYTKELVFCFDGDDAGKEAARRALETAVPLIDENRSVRFMFLPAGQDPDSFIREFGPSAFAALSESALSATDYALAVSHKPGDMKSLGGQAAFCRRVGDILKSCAPGVFREEIYSKLSELTGLDKAKLVSLIGVNQPECTPSIKQTKQQAVTLLVSNPSLASHLPDRVIKICEANAELNFLAILVRHIRSHPTVSTGELIAGGMQLSGQDESIAEILALPDPDAIPCLSAIDQAEKMRELSMQIMAMPEM